MYISITECGLTEAQNFIKALTTAPNFLSLHRELASPPKSHKIL
jgi:hypothetical protein